MLLRGGLLDDAGPPIVAADPGPGVDTFGGDAVVVDILEIDWPRPQSVRIYKAFR